MDIDEPGENYCSIGIPLLVAQANSHEAQPQKSHTDESRAACLAKSCTTPFSKTCFNGLNALSGVGILSVPYALSSGGWLSLIILLIIAGSTLYTGLLIQRCMDMDRSIISYPDIGERAFGTIGRTIVSLSMNTELYLVATGFLILEGDNLYNLLPDMEFKIGSITVGGKQSFVIIVALIILPSVWLNNMTILSYISASGVLASLVLLCSIFWIGAFDGIGFHEKGTLLNWDGIPTAVSLYSFCYCAHPVFPTLYNSMRNQRQFSKVLVLCFFFCTVTYTMMAVLGYLMFGMNLQSQITLNLPTHKISSKVAIYTTLVNPIAKYALMITPLINAIENKLLTNCSKRTFSISIRFGLVLSTVIIAMAIPLFGYLMSLVGAFLSITASVLMPCLCFSKISGLHQRFSFELVTVAGIVIMGISIMVIGTYTSLKEIIAHFVLMLS